MGIQVTQLEGVSESVIPAGPGLHIIHVPSNLPLILIRRALEQAIVAGESGYSFCFKSRKQLTSFLSISRNQTAQVKQLYRSSSPDEEAQPNVIVLGQNRFDVFSNEGMMYATTRLAKYGGVVCTFQQQILSTFQPSQVDGFIRLQNYAREKDICFIVFMQSDLLPDAIGCTELADEYLLLTRCDPYIGATASFSVDSLNRQWLSGFAIGNKQMSSIFLGSHCKIHLQTESFVHEKLTNRLAWITQQLRYSPDEVGKALHISRQTVWRQSNEICVPTPHLLPTPDFIQSQLKILAADSDDEPDDEYLS